MTARSAGQRRTGQDAVTSAGAEGGGARGREMRGARVSVGCGGALIGQKEGLVAAIHGHGAMDERHAFLVSCRGGRRGGGLVV